jgi:hypothetical protein
MAMSHMSHCKNQWFHDMHFYYFCLFYYSKLLIYISNINVFNQLNDLIYMSCGKQII